jgi:lysozyme
MQYYEAIHLIKNFEGFEPEPYYDAAGHLTIGYGTRINQDQANKFASGITQEHAESLLIHHMDNDAKWIQDIVGRPLLGFEMNALLSLVYNIGIGAFKNSKLLKKIQNRDADVFTEWDWVRAGTKILNGLINRRITEFVLYHTASMLPEVRINDNPDDFEYDEEKYKDSETIRHFLKGRTLLQPYFNGSVRIRPQHVFALESLINDIGLDAFANSPLRDAINNKHPALWKYWNYIACHDDPRVVDLDRFVTRLQEILYYLTGREYNITMSETTPFYSHAAVA